MSGHDLGRLLQLCEQALEREGAARASFLDEACGGDADLRRAVEALLAEQTAANGYLETPAWSPAAERLAVGQRLGPYEVQGLIGAGGMGVVYRARDTRLGRTVALKVLSGAGALDPVAQDRFTREAHAIASLNHPHICALYDIGREGDVDFLVMEHLEGETLQARLHGPDGMEARALSTDDAVLIGAQIVDALAAAHARGIVHRDLKPANIMLTGSRQGAHVKLLDFGLAKRPTAAASGATGAPTDRGAASVTGPGVLAGTVGYMSPEQVRGQPVDPRTDLFAFGCVLYEMLSGQRAFKGQTPADTMSAILKEDPPPLTAASRDVPVAIQSLVGRCLAKRSEDRFQSAHDLALALEVIDRPSTKDNGARDATVTVRRHAWPRWQRWAALAGALGLAVFAGTVMIPRLRAPAIPVTASPVASTAVRVTVLPFRNQSGDPAQEYFADALTNELIGTLSQVRALGVTSYTSVMTFKGTKKRLPEIEADLGAEWFVEGSVQRDGDKVRVIARLVRARTDTPSWQETYDRDLRDILALQSQLAQSVAAKVGAALTPHEHLRLATTKPVNPAAYELCVRGWQALNKGGAEDMIAAVGYFGQAAERDDADAPAQAGLSLSSFAAALYGAGPFRELLPRSKAAALRAVQLDDGLADGHAALANVILLQDWDWAGAEREYRRAFALAPGSETARTWLGWYLTIAGRFDEAITVRKHALELDPFSVPANDFLGWTFLYAGRYDDAIRQYEKVLSLDAGNVFARIWLSYAFAGKQQADQVAAVCNAAIQMVPNEAFALSSCASHLAVTGRRKDGLALMGRLVTLSKTTAVEPYFLAYAYAGLGDKARALDLLERTVEERSPNAVMLRTDFEKMLGSEPRYQALLRKINIPL